MGLYYQSREKKNSSGIAIIIIAIVIYNIYITVIVINNYMVYST